MHPSQKNLSRNYLYAFLFSFGFSEAIWVLYLAHKGMSLIQIGALESIFHGTSMAMEIPTGIIADRCGRKTSRILSRLVALASSILMIASDSFWGFAAAFALSALSFNLESGAGDALLYDSLIDLGRESDYPRIRGRLEIAYQGARGLSLVAGGFVASFSYELAYFLACVVHGASLLTALTFREPMAGRNEHPVDRGAGMLWRHCRDSLRAIRANWNILRYILFIETFSLFQTTLYFYFQGFLKGRNHREGYIGAVLALSTLGGAIAASLAHRIEQRLGKVTLLQVVPWLAVVAFALMAFTPMESLGMLLLSVVDGVLFVCFSGYINQMIPSAQRATILSFQAMVFSTMMVVFFPLMGWLAEHQGYKAAFLSVFVLSTLALLSMQWQLVQDARRLEALSGDLDLIVPADSYPAPEDRGRMES